MSALVPFVVAVLSIASVARAQSEVSVETEGCPAALAEAVPPALAVELSSLGADARRELASSAMRPVVRCEGTVVVAAIVRGDARVEQRVDGGQPALARRVAMVLAELAEASAEGEPVPEPPPPDPQVPPPTPPPTPPPASGLRVRLRAAGGAWIGGAPLLALGNLELGAEIAPTENVALVLALAGSLGATDVPGARIDVRLVSVGVSLRLGGALGPVWLGGGPAVRGGAVLWTGSPTDPSRARGADLAGGWLGIGAAAGALVSIPDVPVRIGIEVEGGGIAVHSIALVLDAAAARVDVGWAEARLVVDVAFDGGPTNS